MYLILALLCEASRLSRIYPRSFVVITSTAPLYYYCLLHTVLIMLADKNVYHKFTNSLDLTVQKVCTKLSDYHDFHIVCPVSTAL
jgi:hypothetical protein